MVTSLLTTVGGLGVFLLGMLVLTDGLRALTSDRLQRFLNDHTQSPVSGAVAGALSTAVLQSSSATTVATVGFVGAGLMTFSQALGVIFGANIGTTITGWLVALVGFKLQLGIILMPLIMFGVILKMFTHGWLKHLGLAVAGFGLLFVGIAFLQQGMTAFEGIVTPSSFPSDTIIGRLQLVAIGIAITVVTQSSSAGVATALAALGTGAISFPQAAAMVIGMDVGTTFTALLASIGGGVGSRRTGYAHVIFNMMIGVMAFFLLYPLEWITRSWQASGHAFDPQIGLVAFHTTFNLLGVIAVIGFTPVFARLIIWLVPERGSPLTARLDEKLLTDVSVATYATGATITEIADATFRVLLELINKETGRQAEVSLQAVADAARQTEIYSDKIRVGPEALLPFNRHNSVIHSIDHIFRLVHRCRQEQRINVIRTDKELSALASELSSILQGVLSGGGAAEAEFKLNEFRRRMRQTRHTMREETIAQASQRKTDSKAALVRLDAIRWLHRVSYHAWRILTHRLVLNADLDETPKT
jgi:phosphate:Na+ symporter